MIRIKRRLFDAEFEYELEDGTILCRSEWNGEAYNVNGALYTPIQEPDVYDEDGTVLQYKIIGFEIR